MEPTASAGSLAGVWVSSPACPSGAGVDKLTGAPAGAGVATTAGAAVVVATGAAAVVVVVATGAAATVVVAAVVVVVVAGTTTTAMGLLYLQM